MTSNLLFAYPDIPYRGAEQTLPGGAAGNGSDLIYSGARGQYWIASSATTSAYWDFDLGSAISSQPNVFGLAKADFMARQTTNVIYSIVGSASSSFTSPETVTGSFTISDLQGPNLEDYITTIGFAAAYRYWRFKLVSVSSFKFAFSKLFLGEYLDPGRDPVFPVELERKKRLDENRASFFRLTLNYEGLSDTAINNFTDKVISKADVNPIFIYDTNDKVLNGMGVLHALLVSADISPRSVNSNDMRLVFEEVV